MLDLLKWEHSLDAVVRACMAEAGANGEPRVGVVAIGRNEGERLERCLRSLAPSGSPMVYVDSDSTDGSVALAKEHGAHVLALDLARPFTAALARAEGCARLTEIAPGLDYVMFVDGDCEVEPGWIDAAEAFLSGNAGYAVACGRRRERFPQRSLYNRLMDQEWDTPPGDALACGGDALFRISAYREIGGFDPAMVAGEEPELCSRLRTKGWRIMRLDIPMTIHDADMLRFGQWWRRAIRSGFGYAQAWRQTRGRSGARLYQRELARAVGWAGLLPLASAIAAWLLHPAALLGWPLLTGLQFLRMVARSGMGHAFLSVVGKYAELLGAMRYGFRAMRERPGGTISYK